jgi:hypothetical protein
MAHYVGYNTEVKTSGSGTGDQNNGPEPFPPLKAHAEWKSQPVQTDFAEFITGSVYADQEGTLEIQQTFNYPQDHENETKALEKVGWDVVTTIKLKAEEKEAFQIFAIAPYFRLVYVNGGTEQTKFRVFARAQEKGRV